MLFHMHVIHVSHVNICNIHVNNMLANVIHMYVKL
jgi:hypothetical protein